MVLFTWSARGTYIILILVGHDADCPPGTKRKTRVCVNQYQFFRSNEGKKELTLI